MGILFGFGFKDQKQTHDLLARSRSSAPALHGEYLIWRIRLPGGVAGRRGRCNAPYDDQHPALGLVGAGGACPLPAGGHPGHAMHPNPFFSFQLIRLKRGDMSRTIWAGRVGGREALPAQVASGPETRPAKKTRPYGKLPGHAIWSFGVKGQRQIHDILARGRSNAPALRGECRMWRMGLPGISPEVEYTYDVLDRLTETRRGDLTTTLTYDMAGRKTSMSDPDMGLDVSIRCPRQSDYPGECETSGDQPVLRYT